EMNARLLLMERVVANLRSSAPASSTTATPNRTPVTPVAAAPVVAFPPPTARPTVSTDVPRRVAPPQTTDTDWRQWESWLGRTWLNRVGAIILVFGVGFFLKYAFDNRWIGPAGRVMLGVLAGLALLLVGERLQRAAYRIPAQGVAAAGIATLYLSVYAA